MMDGLYGALFIRRKPGAQKPWSLISASDSDIQAMDKAADDPEIVIISDWDRYNTAEYMDAQVKSGLQIL